MKATPTAKSQSSKGNVSQTLTTTNTMTDDRQVTLSRKSQGRYNPCTIRLSRPPVTTRIEHGIVQLVKMMTEYIKIFMDHENTMLRYHGAQNGNHG